MANSERREGEKCPIAFHEMTDEDTEHLLRCRIVLAVLRYRCGIQKMAGVIIK